MRGLGANGSAGMLHGRRHVVARAPMRVSFVGGGTDFPEFCRGEREGHVVSMAVDLYCYVTLKDMFDANVRVHHSSIDTEPMASRVQHDYARVALESHGLFRGVELVMISDVMVTGSGLGASSSLMTALIRGCQAFQGEAALGCDELAQLSYRLEREAGTVGGLQDQYAAAFGGLNSIRFRSQGTEVRPLAVGEQRQRELTDRMVLVYTNIARRDVQIQQGLKQHIDAGDRDTYLQRILKLSYDFEQELESPHLNMDVLGEILHESWMAKREVSDSVTNPHIDRLYEDLRKQGVIGGKLLGAGGGGFLLGITREGARESLAYSLYPTFIAQNVQVAPEGAQVVWKNWGEEAPLRAAA